MTKENINYSIEQNPITDSILIYLRDEKIDRALKELKRCDKSNLAIIRDTIKILEDEVEVPKNDGSITHMFDNIRFPDFSSIPPFDVPNEPKPVPNTVEMGKVILPDTNFFNEAISKEDLINGNTISNEIAKSINKNMFRGGMN